MEIISYQFFIFATISAIVYHLLPWKSKQSWLLVVSYGFYVFVDVRYALVLALLTAANYFFAYRSQKTAYKKFYLVVALCVNIISFVSLKWLTSKYAGNSLAGFSDFQGTWLLPVGFSFYVLQLISFQLALHNKHILTFPKVGEFFLTFSYFPKLLSGPIEKPSVFLQKLKTPLLVDNALLGKSFGLIFNGLLRKVLIANVLTILIPPNFTSNEGVSWLSVITYGIILYNDFYGYTCVVRGVSLFFGIELSHNFQQPFLARNFSEFWGKWHISLTIWLRENIFFPLSRHFAREKDLVNLILGVCIPPMITMLASGLWHGFATGMIVWGGLHGVFLIIERITYEISPALRPSRLNKIGQFTSGLITFFLVSLSWVPFSTTSFSTAKNVFLELFQRPLFAGEIQPLVPIILILSSFTLDLLIQKTGDELWWRKLYFPLKAFGLATCLMMLTAAIFFQLNLPGEMFIYQGF